MRNFVLGIVVAIFLLALAGLAFALLGYMPTSADANPTHWEERIAMNALDASMDRHAPRVSSPFPATDDSLIDGMKIYTMNCSTCHGTLDNKPSPIAHSFYPPAPQLILHPPDDPEWHLFYAISTGVRYSGMPAWERAISEQDRWKVTAFLSHLEKLPPAVQDYWKKSFGVAPQSDMEMKQMDGMGKAAEQKH
jgi:thiosulfate dehydrogenase